MCDINSSHIKEELNRWLHMYRQSVKSSSNRQHTAIGTAKSIHSIQKSMKEGGYELFETGMTRDVYRMPCGEHVVKIQPAGSSNSREIEMSRRGIPCLCPVLDYSICNGWLVMPYARTQPSNKKIKEEKRYVEKEIHDSGWWVEDGGDIRYLNDEPYLVDYGGEVEKG